MAVVEALGEHFLVDRGIDDLLDDRAADGKFLGTDGFPAPMARHAGDHLTTLIAQHEEAARGMGEHDDVVVRV